MQTQMKASVVYFNMNVHYKAKCITRDKEGHFMVIRSLIYQVETKVLNFKAPSMYVNYIYITQNDRNRKI